MSNPICRKELEVMTGNDLLKSVGLLIDRTYYTKTAKTIMIGEKDCTVWCTSGRGRNARKIYVHFSFDDGVFRAHYRGSSNKKIADYNSA